MDILSFLLVYGQYAYQNSTNALGRTSVFMMDSWIAFANTLHPNRPTRKSLSLSLAPFHRPLSYLSPFIPLFYSYYSFLSVPTWPKYGTARNTLQIGTESATGAVTKLIKDTYREAGIAFLGTEAWTAPGNL